MAWTLPAGRWTVGDDLDWCQLTLHDEGAIIARDELLHWYQDAYRQLCAHAQATRQWRIIDMPARYTITYLHTWEREYTWQGSSRQLGYRTSSGTVCTYPWEVEMQEGLPVTDGAGVFCTQLWETEMLPSGGTADQYHTFALPRNHERIARVYWDNKALAPKSTSEIDTTMSPWWREGGEPWFWLGGTGGSRAFDTYQAAVGYQQGYELRYNEATATGGAAGAPVGIVREASGERTYGWDSDDSSRPYGLVRSVSSSDRQYLAQPTWEAPLGRIVQWQTSALSLMLWEIVIPDEPQLTENDTPVLVPPQLQKYLRAAVLARAFGHQGETQRPDVSAWFAARWQRGLLLMKRLGIVTRRDRTYQRQGASARGRSVPRPRLPSNFARAIGV